MNLVRKRSNAPKPLQAILFVCCTLISAQLVKGQDGEMIVGETAAEVSQWPDQLDAGQTRHDGFAEYVEGNFTGETYSENFSGENLYEGNFCDPNQPLCRPGWQPITSGPFAGRLFLPSFNRRQPDDPLRHIGLGDPLRGTSWRNRPYYFDAFVGGLVGDGLIQGRVQQGNGFIGGIRLGADFDHYWGSELRYAMSDTNLATPNAPLASTNENHFFDGSVLYYPWGDSRWRPYFSLGLGVASVDFLDETNASVNETSVHMPLGVGLKFLWRPWLALRFDLTDNISFGGQTVDTMHNLSFTGGLEFRFGGRRRSYYPYNPHMRLR